MIVVVMGVSGSGKTTIGEALALSLGWRYLDADDFHPRSNVDKMAAGIPLTDDDRWPWLDRIGDELRATLDRREHAVLGCSALKQAYRDRLARAGNVRFVHLAGDFETIAERIRQRKHRYMPPSLLQSQFDTLEPPRDAVTIDVRKSVEDQVADIRAALGVPPAVVP